LTVHLKLVVYLKFPAFFYKIFIRSFIRKKPLKKEKLETFFFNQASKRFYRVKYSMNISDVIFSRRPAERWARALFLLLSVIFHIFIAYYFFTAKFAIEEIKVDKKIILVHVISREPMVFPRAEKPSQDKEDVLRVKPVLQAQAETTPRKTVEPTGKKDPGPVKSGEETIGHPSMAGIEPTPGEKPVPAGGPKRLKAPLNPSYYLKPENLEDVKRG